jgi:hypothetical protein
MTWKETQPTVTEVPMALEPVTHDPFIDGLGPSVVAGESARPAARATRRASAG